MNHIMWIFLTILYGMTNSVNGYLRRKEWYTDGWYIFLPMQVKNSTCNWCCPWLRTCSLSLISVLLMVLCIQQFKKCAWLMVQPWTCHGLDESWQGRCRESFRIHGQPTLADIGDSCYFLGSADVGRSQRFFSDISLNSKSRRKLDKYMRCNDWNIINETIRAQGLANAHI